MNELPCIICGRSLESALGPSFPPGRNQPWDANTFKSYGHYGATIFDNMTDEYLEINICTSCLQAAAGKKRIYIVQPARSTPPDEYKHWNPEE